MVGKAMTKPESKKSSVAAINATGKCATAASAAEQVKNGSVEPGCPTQTKASVMKQTSRECLHRRNTECEVYDDGTNTFFWWVFSGNVNNTNVKYWTLQQLKWWCCFDQVLREITSNSQFLQKDARDWWEQGVL